MKKRPLLRSISLFNPYTNHEYRFRKRSRGKRNRRHVGKKQKTKGEYNLVDRISELPDELVISIVSFLPLKEAAATSILSRRWKHVWKSSTSLNFDVKFGVGKPFLRFCRLEYEKMDQESRRYVNWVDSVMETHRAPTIEQFRVCFDIDCRFTTSVNRWIEFAMNKRVHTLQLEFYRETREDVYQFPHKILGLERESALKLSSDSSGTPSLDFCGCNIRFNFLKVLHFREVDVTQDVFEYFLSNCPVLERLTLDSAENLVTVRVAGPSFALKYLALINCFGLKSVQICDANLVSFYFEGALEIDLLLSNLPSLVEVSYNIIENKPLARLLTQLSCCDSQLQFLMLNINLVDYRGLVIPTFANLKHLELIIEDDCYRARRNLISFLKASPYLQRLVLKLEPCMEYPNCWKILKIGGAHCPHYYIKVVEIAGFWPSTSVKHVMYLIKNAVALEKIVIKPLQKWYWGGNRKEREEVEARDQALQQLKGMVPSNIEFVCI